MNSLFATPPIPPHHHGNTRLSPTRSMSSGSAIHSRKRKASPSDDPDDRMSSSPSTSPAISASVLPPSRSIKRAKSHRADQPLSVPRLLETLDQDSLRSVLSTFISRHSEFEREIFSLAPRPSVSSTLTVLNDYREKLQSSFPFGGSPGSDYAYNRVRPALNSLLEALSDFTPQFLPPTETQTATSLSYLDGATQIIHSLPMWDQNSNNIAKDNAYEEIARAWALVLREAGKRGAGMGIVTGQWDAKIRQHYERSGARMGEAIEELNKCVGWMGQTNASQNFGAASAPMNDRELVRQQLLSGTYGAPGGIRTGFW